MLSSLIKCTTQEEYDATLTYIIQQYEKIDWNNKKLVSLLISLLKKAGLKYEHHTNMLKVVDKDPWDSIALIFRVQLKMPSTTNALEATHGHMNKATPRHNNFYKSIVEAIMKKISEHSDMYST